MNEHCQYHFWTLVLGRIRTDRKWEVFTPHGPLVEALLDRFCVARQEYLISRGCATDEAEEDRAKNPIFGPMLDIASKAQLVSLFYAIPDDCDLLFAPSPPGRAASPVDDAVAGAATVGADESSGNTTEEQEDQEDDSPADNSLVVLQLWPIVRPLAHREQERLGLRTYRRNDLAKYLRNNTQ
ncbi:uncharacterized protein BDZ83DRAFT_656958 [Colletotrichum acutatum]|uniref:Uncharacterized protein n=1 Tax=Glomerella acutata TaxID=27357 RepID=A0AAD8UC00_GLOAC|nr:uncharacterized protein BDZ83DRAFT_656958 [Colletotrichum acutatum]KAK1710904.1 hypothetical protein BDZ83DRAFT_656958 [Colletotrichum acutatum]